MFKFIKRFFTRRHKQQRRVITYHCAHTTIPLSTKYKDLRILRSYSVLCHKYDVLNGIENWSIDETGIRIIAKNGEVGFWLAKWAGYRHDDLTTDPPIFVQNEN